MWRTAALAPRFSPFLPGAWQQVLGNSSVRFKTTASLNLDVRHCGHSIGASPVRVGEMPQGAF